MINDSGARREFETGAVRDIQEGKGRCDLLPLDVVASLFSVGDFEVFHEIDNFVRTGDEQSLAYALFRFVERTNGLTVVRIKDDFDIQLNQQMFEGYIASTILEVSKHFEEGAKKYGEYNWQKGIPTHCYIDSAVRHFLKFIRGDKDEPHDRAFVWNILCCMWTCKNKPELNDYPRKEVKEPEKEEVKVERCCDTCMYPAALDDLTCGACVKDSGFDNPYPLWKPRKEGNDDG